MIDSLLIKLFSTRVGIDRLGNQYYLSLFRDYRGKRIRQVLYNGLDEATKITAEWYSWIHYLSEFVPITNVVKSRWQQDRRINRTGSREAYSPDPASLMQAYHPWQPNQNSNDEI